MGTILEFLKLNPRLIPTIQIALSLLAAIPYALKADWRHTMYWVAGAAIVYSVTY
jgi:hypothetical protein